MSQSPNDDVVARKGSVERVDGTLRSSIAIVKRRGHAAAPSVCSLKTALRGLFKNPKGKHVVTLSLSLSRSLSLAACKHQQVATYSTGTAAIQYTYTTHLDHAIQYVGGGVEKHLV